MGRSSVKYLKFSLLVASVFIFTGSARASENKNATSSVNYSGNVVVNDSNSNQMNSTTKLDETTTTSATGKISTNTQTNTSGEIHTNFEAGDNKAGDDIKAKIGSTDNTANTASSASNTNHALGDLTSSASGLVNHTSVTSAPIKAHLATYKTYNNLNKSGEYVSYSTAGSPTTYKQPAQPATNNQSPVLPLSQSEMLVASLSQLLLIPNIQSKIALLDLLPVGILPSIILIANLVYPIIILMVIGIIGAYLLNLRKSGFWHGARSITLWNISIIQSNLKGLVRSCKIHRLQAYFIDGDFIINRAISTGGKIS